MAHNGKLIAGHFEQLPDEILFDLFEKYVRLIDVYSGFYFLYHRRINRILNACRFRLSIPLKDVFHMRSFSYFASQIVSLNITMFCNDLQLSKFINLESLHFEKPTRTQLFSITPQNLPKLRYLSLLPCWYSLNELPNHLRSIKVSCSFKYLQFCILPSGERIRLTSSKS